MLVDALSLEFVEPLIQRLLPKAAVAAQLHMWDAAGARLRPHPVLGHAQALGYVVNGEKAGHNELSRPTPGAGNRAQPIGPKAEN